MTPSRKRGEYAKSAERRAEILDAGLAVFSASGFRGGSLREVAERVGLSQAGVLHHFPNKQRLLIALLERRDAEQLPQLDPDSEGLDVIRGLVNLARYNAEHPSLVALYSILLAESVAPDHPAYTFFMERQRWVSDLLTRAFELASERGQVRLGVQPTTAARTITALMDGLQLQWLRDPTFDMAQELRTYLQTVLTVDIAADERSAA